MDCVQQIREYPTGRTSKRRANRPHSKLCFFITHAQGKQTNMAECRTMICRGVGIKIKIHTHTCIWMLLNCKIYLLGGVCRIRSFLRVASRTRPKPDFTLLFPLFMMLIVPQPASGGTASTCAVRGLQPSLAQDCVLTCVASMVETKKKQHTHTVVLRNHTPSKTS